MNKLLTVALLGALVACPIYAKQKSMPPVLPLKATQALMQIEDLAHELSDADKDALYHNVVAKMRHKIGLSRLSATAQKINNIIAVQYENMQHNHQAAKHFLSAVLDILEPLKDLQPAKKNGKAKTTIGTRYPKNGPKSGTTRANLGHKLN